jgi:hypothetical protein
VPIRLIPELAALFGGDEVEDDFTPSKKGKKADYVPPKPEARQVDPYKPTRPIPRPDTSSMFDTAVDELKAAPGRLVDEFTTPTSVATKIAKPVLKTGIGILSAPSAALAGGVDAALDVAEGKALPYEVPLRGLKQAGKSIAGDLDASSVTESINKHGGQIGALPGLALDIATDPTNLIPGKAALAAVPVVAGMRGLGKADDVARVVARKADDIDVDALLREADLLDQAADGTGIQLLDDITENASGESGASQEAISRLRGMTDRGEQFAVRTAGGVRPLIGADAVDYVPRPGEQFGILRQGSDFSVLQDGGRPGLMSQRGVAAASLLPEVGGAASGAVVGGAVDDENPLRGAALGGLAGLAGGAAVSRLAAGAAPAAAAAVPEAVEATAQPYIERLIKRVPERPEALGQPLTGVTGADGLVKGTARRAEEEARFRRFVSETVGIIDPQDQNLVATIMDDGERFYEHRRITRPWSQAEDESWKLAWRGIKLPKGATLNDSQMMSLERKVRGVTEYASEVAQDVEDYKRLAAAGDPQAAALLNKYGVSSQNALEVVADQSMEEAMVGWRSVTGVRSELGRGLNSLKKKIAQRSVAQSDEEFIQRAAAFGTEGSEIRQAMTKLTSPEQRYQFLRNLARPDGQALFKWYYISSLLSGPKTHARNIASNTVNALAMNVGNVAGGAMDVARGRVSLNDFRNETAQALRGQIDGIGKGWRAAMDVWRQGFTAEDAMTFAEKPPEIRMSDVFGTTKFDSERSTRWLNSVSRFLEASDQFSRTIMFSGALHQGAYREASRMLKAGKIKPSQFQKTIDEIVADPALLAPKVFQEAVDISKDAVYRQDAGKFLQGVMQMQKGLDEMGRKYVGGAVEKLPTRALRTAGHVVTAPLQNAGTVVAPFIKTPAGVFKKQFRAMGGGFVTADRLAKDGKDLQAAIHRGEAMLGTSMMALPLLYMMQQGPDARPFITGAGPNNPDLKEQDQKNLDAFYGSGRPSSFRLPGSDTWVDYRALGPLAGPLSVVGNLSDAYHQNRGMNFQAASEMFARQARSMMSNSFLTGVMGLVSAFEDRTGTSANRVIGRTVAGFVPASGALRGARQFNDSAIRDTRDDTLVGTVQQNVANIVPGMSRGVPARVDYAGQVLRTPGSSLARVVNPFDVATVPEDAVRNEAAKLGPEAYLAKPSKSLKDEMGNPMDLTNLQSTELQRTVGIAQYQAAQRLLATPGFRDLPPDQRAQMLREIMAEHRETAKQQYRQHVRSVTTEKP